MIVSPRSIMFPMFIVATLYMSDMIWNELHPFIAAFHVNDSDRIMSIRTNYSVTP